MAIDGERESTLLDYQVLMKALVGQSLSDLGGLKTQLAAVRDRYARDDSPSSQKLYERALSLLEQLESNPKAALERLRHAHAVGKEKAEHYANLVAELDKEIAEEREGEDS